MSLYFNDGSGNSVFNLDTTLKNLPTYNYITDANNPIAPAYGSNIGHEPRLVEVEFGDGYRQTAEDGINIDRRVYSLTFNLTNLFATALIKFFKGVDSPYTRGVNEYFYWTPPAPEATTGKFVCKKWNLNWEQYNKNIITATFEEVFDT